MTFQTLDDLDDGQRVLIRFDLNSPVEDGEVQDNRRFARHAATLRELVDRDFAVAVMAHQGRPGDDDFVSLSQHAEILSGHIDSAVDHVADTYGDEALDAIDDLAGGDVLVLENTRMADGELPEEEPEVKADTEFVQTLAPEFDAYINDAYSAAHRSHASLVGFPVVMDAYAGRVMETEYEANTSIAEKEFDGQVTMAMGGTKATDVIGVIDHIGDKIDDFVLGGIAGQLFLRAQGYPIGYDVEGMDLFTTQWENNQEIIEEILDERGDQITVASDVAYGEDGERVEVDVEDVDEKGLGIMDIGTDTAEEYADLARESDAVFVKGALGVFEDEKFATGTVTVLEAIAETDCFSVVGGGDTSRAITMYGMSEDSFDHVSIAGGAYIRALTGDELVGVEVLREYAE
ncbi:phosphoglycerate kinase [Haloarcula salinisoli]|uniref:Phosphoglycerate kinase n=1 Tax=Haloarcula salinisoli TaxID=2487746 RepID=A0A8J7YFV2_9EURY|nr:phosphoglycerate kinase [Halomicroarcula salinisoli]MBX0288115.1 phosphoglycerate kinase [Halomicroarcula salinisoli]MBX0305250.1 phosphoglycerate kinase [Halomicroarcula salinisoli]